MEMLEANYRTWCAQNNVAVEDGPAEESRKSEMDITDEAATIALEEPWDGIHDDENDVESREVALDDGETMDLDEPGMPDFFQDEELDERAKQYNKKPGSKRNRKGKVAMLIKAKVERVFAETGLGDKRARMCDEGEFLKLLWAFNKEGIHFS